MTEKQLPKLARNSATANLLALVIQVPGPPQAYHVVADGAVNQEDVIPVETQLSLVLRFPVVQHANVKVVSCLLLQFLVLCNIRQIYRFLFFCL